MAGCAGGNPDTGFGGNPSTSSFAGSDAASGPGESTASTAASTPAITSAAGEFPAFASSVSSVTEGRLGASYRQGCPVGPEALSLLRLAYVGFDGMPATGELIVATEIVGDVVEIFAELYAQRFPIRSMATIEAFGADDDASMAADNTSAFNCRPVTGGQGWSLHSYGVAIDVNPRENPYVSGDLVLPPEGRDHLDRDSPAPGMIRAGDPVLSAFTAHGFTWGGSWTDPVDYQHFER
ncbi:MAG: M15 family metallopeptidase [Geodermatophilaceae bacterium]|nr:M15 family metallopeptidase [Geodermatophilaceae bacterium]